MATFDQLSPEQRAIVELVLQQGKRYPELAEMLGLPEARVRELARAALTELAPVSVRAVEDERRGELADYVLGQQTGSEAAATRGHLRRSEAARSYTRSLLDSLSGLYQDGTMPEIPGGERGPRTAAAAPPAGRWLALAGALAVVALIAVLVWPIGVLTGDDEEPAAADGGAGAQSAAASGSEAQGAPAGIAIVVEQDGKRQLLIQAARLDPSSEREAYEVWLYNSRGDAKSLGGQVTDEQGNLQAIGDLPDDFADYRYIDVSREPLDRRPGHAGDSALRGRMPRLRRPGNAGKAQPNQPIVLGQTVLAPPRP